MADYIEGIKIKELNEAESAEKSDDLIIEGTETNRISVENLAKSLESLLEIVQSIKVGTTTTGDPGTDASVENSGTDQNLVLDFTIPQGEKGDTGDQGPQGETGPQGESTLAKCSYDSSTKNLTLEFYKA